MLMRNASGPFAADGGKRTSADKAIVRAVDMQPPDKRFHIVNRGRL